MACCRLCHDLGKCLVAGDPAQGLYDDVCFCADDVGRLITSENRQRCQVTTSPGSDR